MLPGISIKFDNGNLNTVVPTDDGVFGLLASAVAVVDKFALGTPYTIKSMVDVAALGIIDDADNGVLYNWLNEYYEEAGQGAEIWLMGFDKDDAVSDWFTPDGGTGIAPCEALLDAANGRLSGLFTCFSPTLPYVPTIEDGLDADVVVAKQKAQILAESYTDTYFTPLFVILEGYAFTGVEIDLPTINEGSDNRVGIMIGASGKRTDVPAIVGASTACLAGRLAVNPINENPGYVKRGALTVLKAYIVDTPVEAYNVEALHNKGFITFVTHVRKSGYFFSDAPLATDPSVDDYHDIPLRRTIDKAFKLAHNIGSNEILANFELNNDGTVSPFFSKAVEANIENEIFNQMTAKGELSRDATNKDDLGVEAAFNMELNVAQTNRLEMTLRVRPNGYLRWFDILLGYSVSLNN